MLRDEDRIANCDTHNLILLQSRNRVSRVSRELFPGFLRMVQLESHPRRVSHHQQQQQRSESRPLQLKGWRSRMAQHPPPAPPLLYSNPSVTLITPSTWMATTPAWTARRQQVRGRRRRARRQSSRLVNSSRRSASRHSQRSTTHSHHQSDRHQRPVRYSLPSVSSSRSRRVAVTR